MSASAWTTIASLATALGTLVLAVATFSAVRSSNLMAKIAQEQFLVQLRPGVPSLVGRRLTDFAGLPLVLSHPVHHN